MNPRRNHNDNDFIVENHTCDKENYDEKPAHSLLIPRQVIQDWRNYLIEYIFAAGRVLSTPRANRALAISPTTKTNKTSRHPRSKMLFKKLRSLSSSAAKKPKIERVASQAGDAEAEPKKSSAQMITREVSGDYELFLEKARQDAEAKDRATVRMAKEAERRRREFNMDPWASRI